ncbi:MAG: ferrochelatase [Rickettsiales bacterium]|jgi:ferrochelatase
MGKKTAIILFNSGGPNDLKSVNKFLFNFFNDKSNISLIQPFRFLLAKIFAFSGNKKTQEIYAKIGGKSPILATANAQSQALEKKLSFLGDFRVLLSMRYSRPFSSDTIKEIKKYQPDEIILLPLYPQFSTATTESAFNDFYKKLKKSKITAKLKYVCCYPIDPDFINAHCRLILAAILKAKSAGFNDCRLLFVEQNIKQKAIDSGDSHCFQINASVEAVIKKLARENLDYKICYQSKIGQINFPKTGYLERTKPSLEFEIKKASFNKKPIIVVPISLTFENAETLVGIDIEYQKLAMDLKIPFFARTPALSADGYFISGLADICKRTSAAKFDCNGGEYGARICPKNFKKCINPNQIIKNGN